MKKKINLNCFTLIETLISAGILSLLILASLQLLSKIQFFSLSTSSDMDIQTDANTAMKIITSDLSTARVLYDGGTGGVLYNPAVTGTGKTNANKILPNGILTSASGATTSADQYNGIDLTKPNAAVFGTVFAGMSGQTFPTNVANAIVFLKANGSDYITFKGTTKNTKKLYKYSVVCYYLALNTSVYRDQRYQKNPDTVNNPNRKQRYLRSLIRLESVPFYDTSPLTGPNTTNSTELYEFLNSSTATIGTTIRNVYTNSNPQVCTSGPPFIASVLLYNASQKTTLTPPCGNQPCREACAATSIDNNGTVNTNKRSILVPIFGKDTTTGKLSQITNDLPSVLTNTPAFWPYKRVLTDNIAANVIGTPTSGSTLYNNSGPPNVFGPGGVMFRVSGGASSPVIDVTIILGTSYANGSNTFILNSSVTPGLL